MDFTNTINQEQIIRDLNDLVTYYKQELDEKNEEIECLKKQLKEKDDEDEPKILDCLNKLIDVLRVEVTLTEKRYNNSQKTIDNLVKRIIQINDD